MPYFSVVTPSYNQGPHIEACLRCVLDQNDPDFEHIVVDNCSTDETPQVLARYPQLKLIVEKDRGQSDAINKGFRAAAGEIICWLNSDDAYPEGTFQRLREAFADPAVDVVFGDVLQVAYDGSADQRSPARFDRREDLVRWWSSEARLHQPAIFFRRSVYEKIGPLREDLHFAMDYEYWWRMSEAHQFHYRPEVLAIQHRQPDSKTIRSWHRVYEDRERIFAPFYHLIDQGNRSALLAEKRESMAHRHLSEAFASAPISPSAAWASFRRAWKESPRRALHPSSLGIFRRMLTTG